MKKRNWLHLEAFCVYIWLVYFSPIGVIEWSFNFYSDGTFRNQCQYICDFYVPDDTKITLLWRTGHEF